MDGPPCLVRLNITSLAHRCRSGAVHPIIARSQRVPPSAGPMTAPRRSNPGCLRGCILDCFAALAMTEWRRIGGPSIRISIAGIHPRSRGMFCPSFALLTPFRTERAQGRPGAGWHPWALCDRLAQNAQGEHGTAETSRPSLRSGLTAYGVLSPATNSFLSPSLRELTAHRARLGRWSLRESLTVATTARTTRFCRTRRRRSSCTVLDRSQSLKEPPRDCLSRRRRPRPPHPCPRS